jgi:hypothetical protein
MRAIAAPEYEAKFNVTRAVLPLQKGDEAAKGEQIVRAPER